MKGSFTYFELAAQNTFCVLKSQNSFTTSLCNKKAKEALCITKNETCCTTHILYS